MLLILGIGIGIGIGIRGKDFNRLISREKREESEKGKGKTGEKVKK